MNPKLSGFSYPERLFHGILHTFDNIRLAKGRRTAQRIRTLIPTWAPEIRLRKIQAGHVTFDAGGPFHN